MRLQLLALALVATIAGTPAFAGDQGYHGKDGGCSRSRAFCPHCGDACYPTVTKGTETKTCWNVETKSICIPRIRFPWEKACCDKGCGKDGCVPPKCGRTKCVNVLMKHEYECSTCKYSWDVDSYKQGNGKSDKAAHGPTEAAPAVPQPPAVDAGLERNTLRVAPISFERSSAAAPAEKSYAEILTSLFR